MSEFLQATFPESQEMADFNSSYVGPLSDEKPKKEVVFERDSETVALDNSPKNEGSVSDHGIHLRNIEDSVRKDVASQNEQHKNAELTWPSTFTSVNQVSEESPMLDEKKSQRHENLSVGVSELEGMQENSDQNLESSALLCRLCAFPCHGSAPIFLFQHPPHFLEVLPKVAVENQEEEEEVVGDILSMIRATLPIKVSCCDKLPKQVCKICVDRLRLSYTFRTTVLKAESQLMSLRAHHKSSDCLNDDKVPNNLQIPYDCPICRDTPFQTANLTGTQTSFIGFQGERYAWDGMMIKSEPEETLEPSNEDLEKSYNELFGGQKDFEMFKSEEQVTLKPLKRTGIGGRKPRGRPRVRQPKVIPRGRRGRRSTQTTVEKILELSRRSPDTEGYGFRICSRENNSATEALTQCLLCDQWFPGAASCLQHSLGKHMDCGAFLCPRCPRDDFPGDFELIQHYQEAHCPDLELYEVYEGESNEICAPEESKLDHQTEFAKGFETKRSPEVSKQSRVAGEDTIKLQGFSENTPLWNEEAMEIDPIHTETPPNEFYESQDELSSNISEVAPRSLTSHSALCEEESISISTQGSDSNLASEDIIPNKDHGKESLLQEDSNIHLSCNLGVRDMEGSLRGMEDSFIESSKLRVGAEMSNIEGLSDVESLRNDFKVLQEDCQIKDHVPEDELSGFQEAANENIQEVSFNGKSIHFDSEPL